MAKEKTKSEASRADEATGSLLGDVPPTDPGILKAFTDDRARSLHYAAIGRVTAEFAYFEAVIDFWLAAFAEVEAKVGVCFTGQMIGPNPRINAFVALVRHRGARKKWNAKLEKLAQDAKDLGLQRNRAVHDVWDLSNANDPLRLEATAMKSVRVAHVKVPTASLHRLVGYIASLRERLDDLASEIFTEVHSSADTSPETVPPSEAQ